jgi:hypothetical protein
VDRGADIRPAGASVGCTNETPEQLSMRDMRELLARKGPEGVEAARREGRLNDLLAGKTPTRCAAAAAVRWTVASEQARCGGRAGRGHRARPGGARRGRSRGQGCASPCRGGRRNITADDLPRLRGLGEFLNARLRGLRARRAAAADDRRLRGIAEIRGEVEAYAAKAGDDLVNAERALLDAAVALRERLHAHNAVVAGWRSIWQRTSAFPCTAADHRFHRNATAGSPPLGDGIAVGLQRVAKAEIDQIIGRAMDHAAKVGTVGIDPASLPSGSSGLGR